MSKMKSPNWLLNKDEAKLFRQILSLDDGKCIEKTDTIVIAMLVDALIDFMTAKEDIEKNGVIIETVGERGIARTSVSPHVAIKKEARQTVIKISQEIGFTPKARASISAVIADTGEKGVLQDALTKLIEQRSQRREG